MTINPQSSITDMAAHLNAKPTVGPDYLKVGAQVAFGEIPGHVPARLLTVTQIRPLGRVPGGRYRAAVYLEIDDALHGCPVAYGDKFISSEIEYEVVEIKRSMKATAHQAAKSHSFSFPPAEPVVDGCTTSWIFRTYEEIQREVITPWKLDDKGNKVPRLTPKQLESARSMWAARLEHKLEKSAEDDARRAPSVKCQGLWADPDENL